MDMLSKKISFAALALFAAGCAKNPYTQIQIAYGRGEYYDEAGNIELICPRLRSGGETSVGEYRLGVDVCHGKLPVKSSEDVFSIEVPYLGVKEATVYSRTERTRTKVSSMVEYKLGSLKANLPTDVPAEMGWRAPGYKDVELSFWTGTGYNIDVTVKSTDYQAGSNVINNIPSVGVSGQFFWELSQESLFLGRFPVGTSARIDHHKNVDFFFSGGYRISW